MPPPAAVREYIENWKPSEEKGPFAVGSRQAVASMLTRAIRATGVTGSSGLTSYVFRDYMDDHLRAVRPEIPVAVRESMMDHSEGVALGHYAPRR